MGAESQHQSTTSSLPEATEVHSADFNISSRSLADREYSIFKNVRPVHQVEVEDFIRSLLPSLPDGVDAEHVLSEVENDESANPWASFSADTNSLSDGEIMFKPLQRLFDKSIEVALRLGSQTHEQTFSLIVKPREEPWIPTCPTNYRPSSLFYFKTGSHESYYDISLMMEFKKERGERVQDNVSSPSSCL